MSIAVLSNGSPTLYCLIFLLLLVYGSFLAAYISDIIPVHHTKMKATESFLYFVNCFIDTKMISKCSIIHFLQNRLKNKSVTFRNLRNICIITWNTLKTMSLYNLGIHHIDQILVEQLTNIWHNLKFCHV